MFFNSSSEPCEEIGGLLAELEEDRFKDKHRPDIDNEEVLFHSIFF